MTNHDAAAYAVVALHNLIRAGILRAKDGDETAALGAMRAEVRTLCDEVTEAEASKRAARLTE